MKKSKQELFRINSPYGIIIRLSDLRYSWFNRNYKEQYDETSEPLPWEMLYKFDGQVTNKSVVSDMEAFTEKYKEFGVTINKETVAMFGYLRVWLYNDANTPFRIGKEIESKMNQYQKRLFELEGLI